MDDTPTPHAADEAEAEQATIEAALLNWYCEHYNPLRIPMADFDGNTLKHYVEKRVAFVAGYSAASAQSHALVTRAVEVAIEAAAKACADYATLFCEDNGNAHTIRALDVKQLVAAALQSQAKGENA